jgi:sulfoquinovosidase
VPLAGLWIQDWTGVRITSAGTQLWWNWTLDETLYPGWSDLVADLAADGQRMLVYINPFLSIEPGHDSLFREAATQGFLVTRPDGTPYLIRNTDFSAALIDLSNPGTRAWMQSIIADRLIGQAGATGWMADFGEATPFDGVLHGGTDPLAWHNEFPVAWAETHRAAIEAAGKGDDAVFFNRSGFTRSPGAATLFWLGDQLQSWDEFDGIKSSVVGLLSGGVSGFSLLHGDVGGYVSLSLHVAGHKVPVIARSDELLQRWMELAAFTAVFRTHEGLDPTVGAQFDSSPANAAHLARFGTLYRALGPYRKVVVADASRLGHPVLRHPFLHFPDDPNTHAIRYQFLLGPDLMVAPVLDRGVEAVEVYFPAGSTWSDLWTGADVGQSGHWSAMPAPLGRPAAFLRRDGRSSAEILSALQDAGLLATP